MISSREAARRLGVSQATISRAAAKGSLLPSHVTPGGHRRFREQDLEVYRGAEQGAAPPALLGTREAARVLGVSQPTLNRAIRRGRLQPALVTPGGHRRFKLEQLSEVAPVRIRKTPTRPRAAVQAPPALAIPAAVPFVSTGRPLLDRARLLLYRMRTGPGMAGPPPPPSRYGDGGGGGPMGGGGNGGGNGHRRPERRHDTWTLGLNVAIFIAAVLVALPVVALVRGLIVLVYQRGDTGLQGDFGVTLAFIALLMGALFFAYSTKYYLSTVVVLLAALTSGRGGRIGDGARKNGNGHANGHANGNGNGTHLDRYPFVSIHIASYNEKRVIERLLTACAELDYPEYEVIVVDDSTDESKEILARWRGRPRFKVLQRTSRRGFKGGALQEALALMDPRAEYVVIWDADSLPFPDSLQRFVVQFYETNGNGNGNGNGHSNGNGNGNGAVHISTAKRREWVGAVQSYQWHVLNKSESWLTEGVRAEYAGSYMVERPFQEAVGSLKMIAGTSYMIRADLLREIGWGTSLTEDWELTLRLYSRGYKVLFTPYAETPAECVGTFGRLARQRMRWAEGHSHNVRRWFLPILFSPFVSPMEKLEFVYYSTYYLQAFLFVVGSLCWLVAEIGLHAHVPDWTAVMGWSLLLSNFFSLPLMNLGGLILEEAPSRDLLGVFGAVALSWMLVPFQAYAALKGFFEKDEGPWFRTPKTGRVTDEVRHLRRIRRWLHRQGAARRATDRPRPSGSLSPIGGLARRSPRIGWIAAGGIAALLAVAGVLGSQAPVVQAAGSTFFLNGANGCAPGACHLVTAPGGGPKTVTYGTVATAFIWSETTSNPAAQTVPAGTVYTLTYWSQNGFALNATITFYYSAVAPCAAPTGATNLASWSATLANGNNQTTTSPASASPVTIPAGAFLCLQISATATAAEKFEFGDNGKPTNLASSATIFAPELLIPFLGLGLLIPAAAARLRRRPARSTA